MNLQKGDPLCVRTAFICTALLWFQSDQKLCFALLSFCFFCGVFQSRLQALQLQEEASDKFRSGYHLRSSVICLRRSRRNDLRATAISTIGRRSRCWCFCYCAFFLVGDDNFCCHIRFIKCNRICTYGNFISKAFGACNWFSVGISFRYIQGYLLLPTGQDQH